MHKHVTGFVNYIRVKHPSMHIMIINQKAGNFSLSTFITCQVTQCFTERHNCTKCLKVIGLKYQQNNKKG